MSVHPLAAGGRAAHAHDLVRVVLDVELVVVGELLAARDAAPREDDDAQVAVHLHGLGHAVGLARVVDVARQPAAQRGVHHAPLVQPEHVDAAVLFARQQITHNLSR